MTSALTEGPLHPVLEELRGQGLPSAADTGRLADPG